MSKPKPWKKLLTARQSHVLFYYRRFAAWHGRTPCLREAKAALGVNSLATMFKLLDRLVRLGHITKHGTGSGQTLVLHRAVGHCETCQCEGWANQTDMTLQAGRVVHVDGIPFRLAANVEVEGSSANLHEVQP